MQFGLGVASVMPLGTGLVSVSARPSVPASVWATAMATGTGWGSAIGVGIGMAVWTGIPLMTPERIGNAEEADTSSPLPRTKLRIGVIRWNRQVTATLAGSPMSRPLGNVGFGIGDGMSQLMTSASAVTSR